MKNPLKSLVTSFGYAIRKTAYVAPGSDGRGIGDMTSFFEDIRARGLRLAAALDWNAEDGRWTRAFLEVFPGVRTLMVEPREAMRAALQKVADENPEAGFRIGGLEGQSVPSILRETGFPAPHLVRMGAPGLEAGMLKGMEADLPKAEVLILECRLFGIPAGRPEAHDAVAWLAERNFRLYDVCGYGRRPTDGALSSLDFVFAREDGFLRRSKEG